MTVFTAIFASLSALLHAVFFVLESVLWRNPKAWSRFGVRDQASADIVAPMAYNQGFYNLFLSIGVVVGLIVGGDAGNAVVVFSCASMLAAALVLVTKNVAMARAATIQGLFPLIAVVGAIIG